MEENFASKIEDRCIEQKIERLEKKAQNVYFITNTSMDLHQ